MNYDWLLFDADGTLFDYHRAERYALEESFREHNLAYSENVRRSYADINRVIWQEFERGLISAEYLRAERFRRLFAEMGTVCDPTTFSATYLVNLARADFLIDGAMVLVKSLSRTHKLALVTNGLTDVQRSRFGRSPVTQFFSVIVISEEVGVVKPDREYFDHTFDLMEHPPRETVLIIGDSLTSDIQGGINYGIDTCWYNPGHLPCTLQVKPTYEIVALEEIKAIVANDQVNGSTSKSGLKPIQLH